MKKAPTNMIIIIQSPTAVFSPLAVCDEVPDCVLVEEGVVELAELVALDVVLGGRPKAVFPVRTRDESSANPTAGGSHRKTVYTFFSNASPKDQDVFVSELLDVPVINPMQKPGDEGTLLIKSVEEMFQRRPPPKDKADENDALQGSSKNPKFANWPVALRPPMCEYRVLTMSVGPEFRSLPKLMVAKVGLDEEFPSGIEVPLTMNSVNGRSKRVNSEPCCVTLVYSISPVKSDAFVDPSEITPPGSIREAEVRLLNRVMYTPISGCAS